MLWVAPSEKDTATDALEKRLWDAADQLRANSGLTSAQYSTPVLGLIFLRFADVRFAKILAGLEKMASSSRRGSRVDDPAAYHWTSQALTDTVWWSLEQGRIYEQSAQAAGYPSEVCVH
jgi:type I restriction-modification system DNA methylase subunit